MTVNLHILFSSCTHETRFLKESKSIINARLADNVLLAGMWNPGLIIHERLDSRRSIWRIPLSLRFLPKSLPFQVLKYLEWMLRFFVGIYSQKITSVQAHSLDALCVGVFVKFFKKVPLVYDAHELETEANGQHGLRKRISKVYELFFIKFVDEVVVVTDSIGSWYKEKYPHKNITVIKNIPDDHSSNESNSSVLRDIFNISEDKILYLYQGGMSAGRNIELLLNVFSKQTKANIAFMGNGPLVEKIIEFSHFYNNIHYRTAVPPDLISNYTSSADVGIAVPVNSCLSHYYGLGNKHFEYLLNGLPLLVADYPERAKLVDENNCGWKVVPNEKCLLDFINKLSVNDLNEKKENVKKCKYKFHWRNEEKKLVELYRRIIES